MQTIKAEIVIDNQHGPVIRVTIDNNTVSVYLADETGVVTLSDGSQYGLEVMGPWHELKKFLTWDN